VQKEPGINLPNWGGEIVRTNMVSQIMEVEKMLFKGSCSKCNGVAYFSKMDGSPAFCPMCGEDAKDNWVQEKVVGMDEAGFALRELVAALQGVSGMLDYVQKRADKALTKAKEVLGDEV